jgi:hypothetical protein
MREFIIAMLILVLLLFLLLLGVRVGHLASSGHWETKIHNAAATGREITVDGTSYSVYRTPRPKQLQAMRSEYARRCQAITDKFFNEEFKQ